MPSLNIYINEKHKDFLLVLAYVYLQNNQVEKAIIVYKALWYLFPESESLAFCLSYLYLRTQQFENALHYVDAYLAKEGSDLGLIVKSQALLNLGRNFEARQTILQFLN